MKKLLQICAIDLSVDALLSPLITSLNDQGYVVHIACTDTGKFKELREQGFDMIHIPIDRKISPLSNLKTIWNLYKLMKREKYDIVHVHTPIASILGRIAAKLSGIKQIVYTAHGFYFHEGMSKKEYRLFYNIEKFFARYFTNKLLLQSKEDYELCIREKFKSPDHIIHLGNGVDITTKFKHELISSKVKEALKIELGLYKQDIVICFIGRFVKEKGIYQLMESFQKLKNHHSNLKLLMVGDTLTSDRDQSIKKALLEDQDIIIPGFRKDIPEILSISDIFVLPSHREGLPRSIIEAMAMKKPIIASNIRGCREEVFDGENGFLFEKENSEQLFEKLNFLIHNEEKRKLFGEKSRKIVEEEFDERNVIRKQLDLFAEL